MIHIIKEAYHTTQLYRFNHFTKYRFFNILVKTLNWNKPFTCTVPLVGLIMKQPDKRAHKHSIWTTHSLLYFLYDIMSPLMSTKNTTNMMRCRHKTPQSTLVRTTFGAFWGLQSLVSIPHVVHILNTLWLQHYFARLCTYQRVNFSREGNLHNWAKPNIQLYT